MSQVYFGRDLEAMSAAKNYHRWILDVFRPWICGSVIEVGAGTGNLTELIAQEDITSLLAVEPSINMFPFLSEKFQNHKFVKTHKSLFADIPKKNGSNADTIIYINVLEHIEDDITETSLIFDRINHSGHVCIFVPALPFLLSDFDKKIGHFRRYSKPPLIAMLKQAGFTIEKSCYFDIIGVAPWWITFCLLKKTLIQGQVKAYDKYVVPIASRLEKMMQPPLGKNLLVVAKKP